MALCALARAFSALAVSSHSVSPLLFSQTLPSRGLLTTASLSNIKPWKTRTKYTINPIGVKKTGGRDHTGRIRTRGIGGGHKQLYRMVDFQRLNYVPGQEPRPFQEKVIEVRYDPCRSADIALVAGDKRKRWIIATENMQEGDLITSSGHIGRMAGELVEPIGRMAGELVGPIGRMAGELVGPIGRMAGELVEPIGRMAGELVEPIGRMAGELVGPIGRMAGELVGPIGRMAGELVGPIGRMAGELVGPIGRMAGELVEPIGRMGVSWWSPSGVMAGELVEPIGRMAVSAKEGDAHPLGALPVGTLINNLEFQPGKGAQYIRAAGRNLIGQMGPMESADKSKR
uniref:Large ribosomal subunit protein uL2 RNA-binding domain-containing protein n=1 Tax=Xenopus tropicalis TaxID=8364 RepID=A0A803JLR2_XENTR